VRSFSVPVPKRFRGESFTSFEPLAENLTEIQQPTCIDIAVGFDVPSDLSFTLRKFNIDIQDVGKNAVCAS
jgi:hypothetical protein